MATIWDDKNHSTGETFLLGKNANKSIKDAFSKFKGNMIKSDYAEYKKVNHGADNIISIPQDYKPNSSSTIFYFKYNKQVYKVQAKSINTSNFIWSTKGKSTNRDLLTKIKETCSLVMILYKVNKNIFLSEEEMISTVIKDYKITNLMEYYRSVYYTSALAHAKECSSSTLCKFKYKNYLGERQAASWSADIYNIAKKLTHKAPDNWNPSDIWLLSKTKLVMLKDLLSDINKDIRDKIMDSETIAYKFKMGLDKLLEDEVIICISLKQTDRGNSKLELITFENIKKQSSNMNFTPKEAKIRDSKDKLSAYGILTTNSDFEIKWGGRANAQKANINVEGHMVRATHQLGAIDSKKISKYFTKYNKPLLKDSDFTRNNIKKIAEKFKKNFDITELLEHDYVEVKRYLANLSFYELFKVLNKDDIENLFLIAKKIDKINPNYYLLK